MMVSFFDKANLVIKWENLIDSNDHSCGFKPITPEEKRVKELASPMFAKANRNMDTMINFINKNLDKLAEESPALFELQELSRLLGMMKYAKSQGWKVNLPETKSENFSQLTTFPKCVLMVTSGDFIGKSSYDFRFTLGGIRFFSRPEPKNLWQLNSPFITNTLRQPFSLYSIGPNPHKFLNGTLPQSSNFLEKTDKLVGSKFYKDYDNFFNEVKRADERDFALQCAGLLPVVGTVIDIAEAENHFKDGEYLSGFGCLGMAGNQLGPSFGHRR